MRIIYVNKHPNDVMRDTFVTTCMFKCGLDFVARQHVDINISMLHL